MKRLPLVSIIVPTYNSASTLETCLASLKSQSYPNIEIIIVDNYSTDDTLNIAKKYDSNFNEVSLILDELLKAPITKEFILKLIKAKRGDKKALLDIQKMIRGLEMIFE